MEKDSNTLYVVIVLKILDLGNGFISFLSTYILSYCLNGVVFFLWESSVVESGKGLVATAAVLTFQFITCFFPAFFATIIPSKIKETPNKWKAVFSLTGIHCLFWLFTLGILR